MKILIVGNPESHHLGSHLVDAANSLEWDNRILDIRTAWSANKWVNRFCHHLLRKRPPAFGEFNQDLLNQCGQWHPNLVLVTGIAPVSAQSLRQLRKLGILTVNYLTDDPWNPQNGAGYFWDALREYDLIANPRQANLDQLRAHGCRRVEYLPFGYNPSYHFIEPDPTPEEIERFTCQVAILGGADQDRLPPARVLAATGLDLALYGGYWEKYKDLRKFHRGHAYGRDLRLAVRLAGVQVCMGRKANRDGHAMRSLEFPAMGACLVAEQSAEHHALFGSNEDCVLYWQSPAELVSVVNRLINDDAMNSKLRDNLYYRICAGGAHTYANRLLALGMFLGNSISGTENHQTY